MLPLTLQQSECNGVHYILLQSLTPQTQEGLESSNEGEGEGEGEKTEKETKTMCKEEMEGEQETSGRRQCPAKQILIEKEEEQKQEERC